MKYIVYAAILMLFPLGSYANKQDCNETLVGAPLASDDLGYELQKGITNSQLVTLRGFSRLDKFGSLYNRYTSSIYNAYMKQKDMPLELLIVAYSEMSPNAKINWVRNKINDSLTESLNVSSFAKQFLVDDDGDRYEIDGEKVKKYVKTIDASTEQRINEANKYFGMNVVKHVLALEVHRQNIVTRYEAETAKQKMAKLREKSFRRLSELAEKDPTLIPTDLLKDLLKSEITLSPRLRGKIERLIDKREN